MMYHINQLTENFMENFLMENKEVGHNYIIKRILTRKEAD